MQVRRCGKRRTNLPALLRRSDREAEGWWAVSGEFDRRYFESDATLR
jgi:hypothetical protein